MKLAHFTVVLAFAFLAALPFAQAETVTYLGVLNGNTLSLSFNVTTLSPLSNETETTYSELTGQNETTINVVAHPGTVTLTYGNVSQTTPLYLMASEEDPSVASDPTQTHFIFINLTGLPTLDMNFSSAQTYFFPVTLAKAETAPVEQNQIVTISFPETFELNYGDLASDNPISNTLGKITLVRQN